DRLQERVVMNRPINVIRRVVNHHATTTIHLRPAAHQRSAGHRLVMLPTPGAAKPASRREVPHAVQSGEVLLVVLGVEGLREALSVPTTIEARLREPAEQQPLPRLMPN